MQLILLDRSENRIHNVLSINTVKKSKVNELKTLTFMTDNSHVEKYYRILLKNKKNKWEEYIVETVTQIHDETGITYEVYAEDSISETRGDFVEDKRTINKAPSDAIGKVLASTRWRVGTIGTTTLGTQTFYRESVFECLSKITETWELEIETEVKVGDSGVTDRIVHFHKVAGDNKSKRFAWGKDILSVKREVDENDVVTALYGFGRGEEVENKDDKNDPTNGYGRRLDFSKINAGKMYIADENARAIWGRPNGATRAHRFGVVTFDDIEDRAKLLAETRKAFEKLKQPHITYTTTVVDLADLGIEADRVSLGDTIIVRDKELDLTLQARVMEMTEYLDGQEETQIVIGNYTRQYGGGLKTIKKAVVDFQAKAPIYDKASFLDTTGNTAVTIQHTGQIGAVQQEVVTAQRTADGKNTMFSTNATPVNPKLNDVWFYTLGSGDTEMRRYDGSKWVVVISEVDISKAESDASSALTKADNAINAINTAIQNAGFTSLDALLSNMRTGTTTLSTGQTRIIADMGYPNGDTTKSPLRFTAVESKVTGLQNTVGDATKGLVAQVTHIADGYSVLATDFASLVNLAHDYSKDGKKDGENGRRWYVSNGIGTFSDNVISLPSAESPNGFSTYVYALTTTNQLMAYTHRMKVDPTKAYRFSIMVKASHADILAGVIFKNSSGANINLSPISVISGVMSNPVASGCFKAKGTPANEWFEIVGYVIGTGISPSKLKGIGKNVTTHFLMPRDTATIEFRFGNYHASGVSDTAYFAYPSVTEVDIDALDSLGQLVIAKDAIDLRVTKNNLIGEINTQAGKVLIRANDNVLMVSPTTTYIADATIKEAHIANASISTAKIKEIDASKATITNINVNNLVANKASFIETLFNGKNSRLKITPTGVYVNRTDGKSSIELNNNGMVISAYNGIPLGYVGISNIDTGTNPVYGLLLGAYAGNDMLFGFDFPRTGDPTSGIRLAMRISYEGYVDVYGQLRVDMSGIVFTQPTKDYVGLDMNGSSIHTRSGIIDMSHNALGAINWIRQVSNRIEIGGDNAVIFKIGRGGARYLDAYAPLNMNGYKITGQSDSRLKKNIAKWGSVLDDIREMYFARYEWIDKDMPSGQHYGLIAQSAKLLSLEGEDGYLRIDSTLETHVALKATQEILLIVDDHEERIRRLEQTC